MSRTPIVLALLLAGCAGWNNLPDQSYAWLDAPLWQPDGVLASDRGVYVPLPHSGGLAFVSPEGPEGTATRIELGEGSLTRLTASPGGDTVVAFIERYRCSDNPDEKKTPKILDDCPGNRTEVETELNIIRGKKVDASMPLSGTFNAIAYSEDNKFAVAYLDFNDPTLELDGVVNLTSVVVLDLETTEPTPVSVGFAADQVLFVQNEAGETERAVVLSQNEVAVLDLTLDLPERIVTFPLTLDPDITVIPVGVELTPNGQYAMISVAGRSDLYVLDLWNQSINIVELAGTPSAIDVNATQDRTLLVYGSSATVDVLEHDLFDIETFSLDEPMNRIHSGSDFGLLYSTGDQHDAYRLDLETSELTEYRLQNPATFMSVSPTEEFAIALTRPENGFGDGLNGLYDSHPGMEVLNLNDDKSDPFILEGNGLGVAWSQTENALHALVLQQNVDYLYKLNLYTGRADDLELPASPVDIGTLHDEAGTFFVTHDEPLGLITFLNPATDKTTEVSGFATLGLMDDIELQIDEEKN